MKVCGPTNILHYPLFCLTHNFFVAVIFFPVATPEPGEDPRVTRAKFFIRDEFLVSTPTPIVSGVNECPAPLNANPAHLQRCLVCGVEPDEPSLLVLASR